MRTNKTMDDSLPVKRTKVPYHRLFAGLRGTAIGNFTTKDGDRLPSAPCLLIYRYMGKKTKLYLCS